MPVTAAASGDIPVWRPNWETLLLWLDLSTQWRAVAGLGGLVWLGLDYLAVDMMLRRRGLSERVFDELREMERVALPILNERPE